jgi:hypothetical protein
VGLLMEVQRRVPDRWFLRRLLPAAVFVAIAVVCGGQLGQAHWADLGLARAQVAAALRLRGPAGSGAVASLVLLAVAVAVLAFAVPLVAGGVDALVSGAWPWWLGPLGDRVRAARRKRWQSPDDLGVAAVNARKANHGLRAARLDARRAAAPAARPEQATWCGDRFAATRGRIREQTGLEITTAWTALLLVLPDDRRTALRDSRDSYDAACEAVVWSVAVVLLGIWWWPALPVGLVLAIVAWRWLRTAVTAFCATAEAVAVLHAAELPDSATCGWANRSA